MDTDSGLVKYTGSGTYTSLAAGNSYFTVEFGGAGVWTFNNSLNVADNFLISNGTVNASNYNITTGGDFTLSSGTFNAGSATITIGANWDSSGGTFTPGSSTAIFNATDSDNTIASTGSTLNNIQFNNSSGTWTLQDALDVNGNLIVTAGIFSTNNQNINVAGNWSNSGTFIAGTGTVTFDGTTAQSITSGGSAFNTLAITNSSSNITFADSLTATNFTCSTASVDMKFNAGSTYTITNLTLNGSSGNLITLDSTSTTHNPADRWNLNVSGTQSLSYVDASDSEASGGSLISCTNICTEVNDNNVNWTFGEVAINWGDDTAQGTNYSVNHIRCMGGVSPNVDGMTIKSINVYTSGSGNLRLAIYQGGVLGPGGTGPTNATLIWDAGIVSVGSGWFAITGGSASLTKNEVTWICWKANDSTIYVYSNSSYDSSSDFQSAEGRWNGGAGKDETISWESIYPAGGSYSNYWYSIYITY